MENLDLCRVCGVQAFGYIETANSHVELCDTHYREIVGAANYALQNAIRAQAFSLIVTAAKEGSPK